MHYITPNGEMVILTFEPLDEDADVKAAGESRKEFRIEDIGRNLEGSSSKLKRIVVQGGKIEDYLSDDTLIGGTPWQVLRPEAMDDDELWGYTERPFYVSTRIESCIDLSTKNLMSDELVCFNLLK